MPKEKTRTSFLGGGDLAVFKDSKAKDAAWTFVSYLLKPDVQAKWYNDRRRPPGRQGRLEQGHACHRQAPQGLPRSSSNDASPPPVLSKWEEVASAINDEMEKVLDGRHVARARARRTCRRRPSRSRADPMAARPVTAGAQRQAAPLRHAPPARTSTGWIFSLPFVAAVPRLLGAADPRVVRPLAHGLRHHEPARPVRRAVRRARQLLEAHPRRASSGSRRATPPTSSSSAFRSRSRVGLAVAVGAEPRGAAAQGPLPRRLLPPGRYEHRRGRRRSGATSTTPTSDCSTGCSTSSASAARTGSATRISRCRRSSSLGVWRNFGFDVVIFLAALQAIDPALLRGRAHRRRDRVAGLPPHHAAAAAAGAALPDGASRRSATCRSSRSRS